MMNKGSHPLKKAEFYEIISQTWETGFHISYSEIVITPKLVGKSE